MIKFIYQKGVKISLLVGVVVFLVVVAGVSGANAGYTFATGNHQGGGYEGKKTGLELTVDSRAVYNGVLQPALTWDAKNLVPEVDKFFNFHDVKPGDLGKHLISLHVKKSDAYVCLDFYNLKDHENGTNEPEGLVDTENGGELSKNLQFFAWRDDGDGEFEIGEEIVFGTSTKTADKLLASTTYAVADAYTGNSCRANSVNYVGILWCAGELTVDLNTAEVSCDGENMGNESQTDSMTVDMALRAVQAKYNDGFSCTKKVKPPKKDKPKGNNGHGNDSDHNDDSNPGNSNDEDDNTDDDGYPNGQSEDFYPVVKEENPIAKLIKERLNNIFARFGWGNIS